MLLFSGVACEVAEVAQALQIADVIILQTMQSVWYEKRKQKLKLCSSITFSDTTAKHLLISIDPRSTEFFLT